MNITNFTIDKYDEVIAILRSGGHFDDVWDSLNHWQEKIQKEPNSILLAMEGNEVTGCILIIRDPWTSFLFRLAVKETHRNKGIGSQLIKSAEKALKEEGVDEVAIFVDSNDNELQSYYQKHGYIKGGSYKCMYKKLQVIPD